MNESSKVKQTGSTYAISINSCHKKSNLLANKGVISRVTWRQPYLSTLILFYFAIWELKDKTLIKLLQ